MCTKQTVFRVFRRVSEDQVRFIANCHSFELLTDQGGVFQIDSSAEIVDILCTHISQQQAIQQVAPAKFLNDLSGSSCFIVAAFHKMESIEIRRFVDSFKTESCPLDALAFKVSDSYTHGGNHVLRDY